MFKKVITFFAINASICATVLNTSHFLFLILVTLTSISVYIITLSICLLTFNSNQPLVKLLNSSENLPANTEYLSHLKISWHLLRSSFTLLKKYFDMVIFNKNPNETGINSSLRASKPVFVSAMKTMTR